MKKPSDVLLFGVVALLVLIWGTTWAAIRIGLQGVPPFTGAAIRFALSSLFLLALAPVLRVKLGGHPREPAVWLVNGVLLFFVSYGIVYWAEQWVPSGLAAVLFATYPLFVAILAHFILSGERLGLRTGLGTLLGFAGIAIIYSEDLSRLGGPQVATASIVFLLSPFSTALANVLVKRWATQIHPLSTTVVPLGIGTLLLAGMAGLLEREVPVRFDAPSIASIAYLAVFGTATTFLLYFWLLTHFAATKLALIAYGTPVVAVLVGSFVLQEPITVRVLLGSGAVIVGVALATRRT